MIAVDGAFDSPGEAVAGSVGLAGRPMGETLVSVRGRDAGRTWGPPTKAVFHITPTDGVFADGFETGTTGAWSSVTGATGWPFQRRPRPAASTGSR